MALKSWPTLIRRLASRRIELEAPEPDLQRGISSSQARLRLFEAEEKDVALTLYRDNHGWCPYCQKVWLYVEAKQIPYRVEKVRLD